MTSSQRTTRWAAFLASISATFMAVTPYAPLLPEKVRPWASGVAAFGALIGVGMAAYNQSLSREHVSIPVEDAKAVGVAPEQTKGK